MSNPCIQETTANWDITRCTSKYCLTDKLAARGVAASRMADWRRTSFARLSLGPWGLIIGVGGSRGGTRGYGGVWDEEAQYSGVDAAPK